MNEQQKTIQIQNNLAREKVHVSDIKRAGRQAGKQL